MKQIFAFAILLLASLIANAEKVKIGDLYYILDETNKTAEVASKYNYRPSNSDYVSGDLIIPSSIEVNGSEYTITSIGEEAFYECNGLTSVTIPNSVTTIDNYAFAFCTGLASVTIPNSVITIGIGPFFYTNINKAIWMCNTPPSGADNVGAMINYVSNNQFGFSNQRIYPFLSSKFEVDNVVYVPVSPSERTCDVIDCNYNTTSKSIKIDSIVTNRNIRLNVLNINPYAFYGNDSITEVSINNKGAIGDYAFANCGKSISLTIGKNVTKIGNYAFANCNKSNSLTIGKNVTNIGNYAFYRNRGLKGVAIPDNVTSVGESAFKDCSSLESVKIGKGIDVLNKSLFSGCTSLGSITIPNNINKVCDYVFAGCKSLQNVTFADASDAEKLTLVLGSNGSSPLFVACPLDDVYIGRKLSYKASSSYGYSPFYSNASLRTVKITDNETEIYDNEFYGCSNLQEFSCGEGVTKIGKWAFSGCSALKSYASGTSVESIGVEAFSDCTALTSFTTLAATPPTCGNQALDDINKWECTLYVLPESIDKYMSAEQWKEFFFVEKVDGVDDVIADEAMGEVVGYYNLQGVFSAEPWNGFNIVVYSNGSRRKAVY